MEDGNFNEENNNFNEDLTDDERGEYDDGNGNVDEMLNPESAQDSGNPDMIYEPDTVADIEDELGGIIAVPDDDEQHMGKTIYGFESQEDENDLVQIHGRDFPLLWEEDPNNPEPIILAPTAPVHHDN
ncbi:Hypothetical predicted protein, partial [Paramuricea clavata]